MTADSDRRHPPVFLEVAVLGPVAVRTADGLHEVRGHRPRAVLAALVISANRVVGCDQLIDAVWEGNPPRRAAATLQSHVSKLRRLLGPAAIEFQADGYVLLAECDQIDACRFERLVREAEERLAADPERARFATGQALEMWRGAPYGEFGSVEFVALEVRRLEDLRLAAVEVRLEADLALGRISEAVAVLQGEVVEHPYHERLWYLLAAGLAREGRRVEALRALRECERLLADVGLMPAPEFVVLEQEIVAP